MSLFGYLKRLLSSNPVSQHTDGRSGIGYVDAIFQNLVVEEKVPGLSVTILHKGETLLQKGYGYAVMDHGITVDPARTLFRIASISKCITALALGKMVEEGVLHWDDSFYNHVPYYPKKPFDFTLRQLASHTAGIRGYKEKEYALNQPYSIKQSIDVFKNDPLVFEPGKGYLYNSYDFVLLALAMQEASQIPFEEYVRQKVLLPLDMDDTLFPVKMDQNGYANQGKSFSEFYTKNRSGFRKAVEVDNFYKLAGGGYLSTSNDIAKMGQAILDGKLLSKETYDELFMAQMINGKSTYYGLGFQASYNNLGKPFVGHVGNSVGAYTNFFVYPNDQLVVSVLVNCTDPKIQPVLDEVTHKIFFENFIALKSA